jgi:hypothetical protein
MRPDAADHSAAPPPPRARPERLLDENGAGALAVVDDAGQLVGLLLRGRVRRRAGVR